jgi:hypothetical protein
VGRELTYSDPRVIALLNEKFVPVAANISHLQRQDDEEGRFLRLVSWQGRFGLSFEEAGARMVDTDHKECHQGQFVTTTEGELLGSRHVRDPDQLLEMMEQALENWEHRETQHGRFRIGEVERPDTRFSWAYPEDGLVLHLGVKDLPRQEEAPEGRVRDPHNQDYVWITREEMLSIVPPGAAVGDSFPMPEVVTRRLVRFHLIDSVRGETSPWPVEALRDVEMTLAVTGVSPERVDLKLSGHAVLCEEGDWCTFPPRESVYERGEMCCVIRERGFDAKLMGFLSFDRQAERFSRFDLVASGLRWGGTTFNNRREDVAPAPLAVAMMVAGREERDRTPPHASRGSYFEA